MIQRPIRIANVSGFFGDRLVAPREMLDGPDPVDVLTGDYLAELTMLILWKQRQRDASAGYASTFLRQAEAVLATCAERGVKLVTNAGGLNPRGLADRLRELADRLGVGVSVAVVEGDDLVDKLAKLQSEGVPLAHLDSGVPLADTGVAPLTANAYLGGWGIARALTAGADIVVCGRVTDASLVVGPAAWWHRWETQDWDRLGAAVVAGHVIECGPQATGGNYPFLDELPNPRSPGFPIAEVAANGTTIITKQPGTGGVVNTGTVTAQLLYELGEPAYLNPDVVARFDTIELAQEGPDRVAISGVKGAPPPDTLKVAINFPGGYRNTMTMVLTGLDIEGKAEHAQRLLFEVLGGRDQFASVDVQLIRTDRPDAPSNEQATAQLRVTVKDPDPDKVGRRFSNAVVELALANYSGFFPSSPPTTGTEFGVYWPALVPARVVQHRVILPHGHMVDVPPVGIAPAVQQPPDGGAPVGPTLSGATERAPLGLVCGARSGDKGGNANVGLWTRRAEAYPWLAGALTVEKMRELVPEARHLQIRRYELPRLHALNFVIVGILGEGVASSVRMDPQAKGLGEYVRSRFVDIPVELL
ncbi:MAG TPA: acyclic terpene utilization AtuA family protein [Acidimicrobiia bacterium]